MLLICLFLISLTAIIVTTNTVSLAVEQTEFVPIPVRVNEAERFSQSGRRLH